MPTRCGEGLRQFGRAAVASTQPYAILQPLPAVDYAGQPLCDIRPTWPADYRERRLPDALDRRVDRTNGCQRAQAGRQEHGSLHWPSSASAMTSLRRPGSQVIGDSESPADLGSCLVRDLMPPRGNVHRGQRADAAGAHHHRVIPVSGQLAPSCRGFHDWSNPTELPGEPNSWLSIPVSGHECWRGAVHMVARWRKLMLGNLYGEQKVCVEPGGVGHI